MLQAAINGARPPAEHRALPVHPDELAATAKACVAAGAGAVHLHVRGPDGRESLAATDVARAVTAVRAACGGGTKVGLSTGDWIERDVDRRLALIRRWHVLPDFASVNFHEPGAVRLAEELLELGVGVEAGLASPPAAETLARSRLEGRCLRVLLEPQEQALPAALGTVAEMERILGRPADAAPRLLHGTEATAWPLLAEAARRGHDARMGLEDTLRLPGGEVARDNAELVGTARAWVSGLATVSRA